jgi:hydrogenase-4 component F
MSNVLLLLVIPAIVVLLAVMRCPLRPLTVLVAVASWIQIGITSWIVGPVLSSSKVVINLDANFAIDKTAAWFLLLTTAITAAALTHAQFFFAQEQAGNSSPQTSHVRQFYALSALFLIAMMGVYVSNNLGFLWMSVEATTLCSAGLVYFSRTRNALEATWKYFMICSVGIAFALLGTILIFASSQFAISAGTLRIDELMRLGPQLNLTLFKFGFIFCFLGYGTKAGIFPLHSWLPDAHSEAPSPASAMLSGALLNCALFAILRLCEIAKASHRLALSNDLTIWAGCITVVAASFFLIRQHGLKRLWAYSSVENVGLMLIAIGLSSPMLFLLQAANHSFAKVALFLLSGNIIQSTGTKSLTEIRGIVTLAPCWGILLALASFAVTGIPPFGSFISEWLILTRSIEMKHFIPAVLVIIGLSLSFVAVSVHIARILLGKPRPDAKVFRPLLTSLVPAILLCCSFLLGITVGPKCIWGIWQ